MLKLTDLSKTYDGFAFGPADLSVGTEVLAVLGPSGSGKTTLLSLIAGIASPDGGSVSLDGRRLDGRPLEERRTGLVFQDGALFPHMTARENIAYAAADTDRIDALATRFEIDGVLDRRPRTLSGGERRRVALARTLASDPDALLLDEPLSNLDTPIRRRLRDELHDLFGSLDVPVLYVTHDQRTATALGDRIAILRDGAVEQVGPPSDVLARPATRFVAEFTGTENVFEAAVAGRDGDAVDLRFGGYTLRASADAAVGSTVTACVRPSRVRLRAADGVDRADGVDGAVGGRDNTLPGTVRRWLNEGDEYRVVVEAEGAPVTLTATVPPPAFERLALDAGVAVRATVPPDAIHLIL